MQEFWSFKFDVNLEFKDVFMEFSGFDICAELSFLGLVIEEEDSRACVFNAFLFFFILF